MVEDYFNELRRLENLAKLRDINNVLDNLYKLKYPNQPQTSHLILKAGTKPSLITKILKWCIDCTGQAQVDTFN